MSGRVAFLQMCSPKDRGIMVGRCQLLFVVAANEYCLLCVAQERKTQRPASCEAGRCKGVC